MSIYSGFATRNQQHYYDQILYNAMSTLLTRIAKFYRNQDSNEETFITILRKQIKCLKKMEKQKELQYLEPKYAELLEFYLQMFHNQIIQRAESGSMELSKSNFKQNYNGNPYSKNQQNSMNNNGRMVVRVSEDGKHPLDRTYSTLGQQFFQLQRGADQLIGKYQHLQGEHSSLSRIQQKQPRGIKMSKRKSRLQSISRHRKFTKINNKYGYNLDNSNLSGSQPQSNNQSRQHTMILVSEMSSLPSLDHTVITKTKFNNNPNTGVNIYSSLERQDNKKSGNKNHNYEQSVQCESRGNSMNRRREVTVGYSRSSDVRQKHGNQKHFQQGAHLKWYQPETLRNRLEEEQQDDEMAIDENKEQVKRLILNKPIKYRAKMYVR